MGHVGDELRAVGIAAWDASGHLAPFQFMDRYFIRLLIAFVLLPALFIWVACYNSLLLDGYSLECTVNCAFPSTSRSCR